MRYQVVFDLEAGAPDYGPLGFGVAFVAIAAVLLILQRRNVIKPHSRWVAALPYIALVFTISWTVAAFLSAYLQHHRLLAAMRSGHVQVVEGLVTHFEPMPFEGHANESFVVEGHRFAYSDYVVTPGFHRTTSHGGPIKLGLPVRVTFVGDDIVRLEIAR